MIRHIVVIRVNDSATPERLVAMREALLALTPPGLVSYTIGPDLGLRPGNMDLAIVADFDDVEAYLAYDRDPEHDRIRRELIAPLVDQIERCQFEI